MRKAAAETLFHQQRLFLIRQCDQPDDQAFLVRDAFGEGGFLRDFPQAVVVGLHRLIHEVAVQLIAPGEGPERGAHRRQGGGQNLGPEGALDRRQLVQPQPAH